MPISSSQLLAQRLKGLMLFRIFLVTLFMSGAILTNAQALSDLSNTRNILHFGLIISTYLLTIIYALLLNNPRLIRPLANVQIALDLVLGATLVLTTGGMRSSVFLFTLFLPIISASFLVSLRWAMGTALAVSLFILALTLSILGIIPPILDESLRLADPRPIIIEASVDIIFAFLLAWSSGQLATQLGAAKSEIEVSRGDLRELKALNENILASLNSGLMTIDEDARIIFFNVAAEQITGMSSDEVYGLDLAKVFPTVARAIEPVDPTASLSGISPRLEGTYEHPAGERLFLGFSISALRNADGLATGKIIIFQDLSLIKALEEQAQLSERMAAIGHLSAAIAHEVRNPLASISGSVEMLQSLANLSEDESSLMGIIVREVERLNNLISQFLDYSRPRPLLIAPLDVQELIYETVQLFRNSHPSVHVTLEVDEVFEREKMCLDREALQQVLWNLLNNAADALGASPRTQSEDSPLPVIPQEYPLSSPLPSPEELEGEPCTHRIDISVVMDPRREDVLLLSVEDSGEGVPEELAERIFEPFFTTRSMGTGLGLATLYRLIEDHGGRIYLGEPRRLSGARFVVELPTTLPSSTQAS